MYREVEENQWDTYTAKPFSLDLNEALHEAVPDADLDDFYGSIAGAVFGLLTDEDKERLAFEGLRARAGSCIRRDRRPVRQSTNGSARWDTVSEARKRGLESHYVQTGKGLKPLLQCTGWDLLDAAAHYRGLGQAFFDRGDSYEEVSTKLSSLDSDVAELDESTVEGILNV